MFENTSLEQFSTLDDFASVTPVWRPFVQHAEREPADTQASQQQAAERSH